MANKRDTSRQKRARQNRAQREARKARAAAASTPAEQRRARAATGGAPSDGGKAATGTAAPAKKGFFARMASERPVRPGDVPVDLETLEGSWFAKRQQVPGGRHVLMALLLTILLGVMMAFQKFPDPDVVVPKGQKVPATETIFDLVGGWAVPLLLFPILVVGVAVLVTTHPKHRRIWMLCTILLGAAVVALISLYVVYLLVVAYLIFAMQKASKVEGPMPGSRLARAMEKAAAKDAEAAAANSSSS